MSSVFDYLMQETISIRRLTATSATGLKTYSPARSATAATIKGRLEFCSRILVDRDGKNVQSEAILYTPEVVNKGDLIIYGTREWPALEVTECRGLFGGIDYYKVRL